MFKFASYMITEANNESRKFDTQVSLGGTFASTKTKEQQVRIHIYTVIKNCILIILFFLQEPWSNNIGGIPEAYNWTNGHWRVSELSYQREGTKQNKKRGIFACGIRMNYAHGFSFLQIKDGKILQAAEKLTRGILDVDNCLNFITLHNLIPAHVHNFETVDDGGIEQCDDDDNDEVVPHRIRARSA